VTWTALALTFERESPSYSVSKDANPFIKCHVPFLEKSKHGLC